MRVVLKKSTLAVLAATGLAGCTLLYPRFDSLLNPDIAFLNAGEVVDSVKCAVTTFFIDHRSKIEAGARITLQRQLTEPGEIEGRNFCPRADWTDPKRDPKEWRVVFFGRNRSDPKESCQPDHSLILRANADETVTLIDNGVPVEKIPGGDERKLVESLKLHPKIGPKLQSIGKNTCEPLYHVYKYIRFEKGRCTPNGGCKPGTFFRGDGKCGLEDAGRKLVIDPDSDATIELALTAVNTGSMNYQRIDATRLDILGGIIVPSGIAGAPFPALKATDKKTNKVEISLVIPQGRVVEDKKQGFIDKLTKAIELARKWKPPPPMLGVMPMQVELTQAEYERLRRLVRERLVEEAGEYKERCESNSLKVGYLGLANYIDKIVNEQGERIYKGSPDVSLDKLILTSQFQIAFDATAGTENLLRIVPVLQPPVLQLNPDHTHQLKITFKGNKGRSTRAKALSILRKCLSRLENTLGSKGAARYCNRPDAIMLESLISAVEDNASSSAGN